jgi:hypothetical protein
VPRAWLLGDGDEDRQAWIRRRRHAWLLGVRARGEMWGCDACGGAR